MSAPTRLITAHRAAELLGVSLSRVRQFYAPGGPLRKYVNKETNSLRLDEAEVMRLKRDRDIYRPSSMLQSA
jgi:hypothetical protein